MQSAPCPENEISRLAELLRYKILDTPPEEAFDDLVALAVRICGTPLELISLLYAHRQWFKVKQASAHPKRLAPSLLYLK